LTIQINTDSQQLLSFLRVSNLEFKELKTSVEVKLNTDADIQKLTRFFKTRNITQTDSYDINQKVLDYQAHLLESNREYSL